MMSHNVYRTSDELSYLRHLYYSNRALFLSAAHLILSGKSSYDGDGMRVDAPRVKRVLRQLMEAHWGEYPEGLPPNHPSLREYPRLAVFNVRKDAPELRTAR